MIISLILDPRRHIVMEEENADMDALLEEELQQIESGSAGDSRSSDDDASSLVRLNGLPLHSAAPFQQSADRVPPQYDELEREIFEEAKDEEGEDGDE